MALDFTRICRICLEDNKQSFDIFTNYYDKRNTSYRDILAICTNLKPYEGDGRPRSICKECCRQLKRTHSFYTKCEKSERKLMLCLKNQLEENKPVGMCSGLNVNFEVTYEDVKDETSCGIGQDPVLLPDIPNGDIKDKIKIESILNDEDANTNCWEAIKLKKSESLSGDNPNEDCWDAEDNNVLDVIKLQKSVLQDMKERPKKKRGRKKKEGEAQVPESKLPHQCDVCGKFLSTKSNLKAHKLCHTDLRPYMCSDCPATFRGHSALFQHKKVHSGETPYHCEYCPKQFSRRTGLVNHIRMHTGEKHYSCDICFKTFVQSAQLSTHLKRHKGEKPYLCQVCGKGFPIKAELHVHERVHNGEKPYSCHLCAKTFATSGNLSIHIRIHNKEVRYKCKECHRGFVTCSSYNVHLKRHKGQRDYHCECGKTFYTSSALKQHRVVHSGEKKYQCKICNRKFTQTSHLSRHFKKDHAKPNLPVPPSNYYKLVLPGKAMLTNGDFAPGKVVTKSDDALGKMQSDVMLGGVGQNADLLGDVDGNVKSEGS